MLNFDLFNGETPYSSGSATVASLINPQHGFIDWWLCWPSDRRVGKPQCLKKWVACGCATNASNIKMHTVYLQTTEQWKRGIIPLTTTYLNQQRWADWQPEPEKPTKPDVLAELKAHKGTKPSAATLAAIAKIKRGATA